MTIRDIVFKELKQRRVRLVTSLLVIFLATAVIVSMQSISSSSREALSRKLHHLGPNIFILPHSLSATDFYTLNYGNEEMPESHFHTLIGAGLVKKDDANAHLSTRIQIGNQQAILTRIIPSSLAPGDVFLGNEIAKLLKKKENEQLMITGKGFTIAEVMPEKGTIDDIRIFARLKEVQELLGRGRVINAIEVTSGGIEARSLAPRLEVLLPDTKVVTKRRIARVQANTVEALQKYSLLLLLIVLLVGGINIANYMHINVRERRREIGTLLALGATPRLVLMIFLEKAVIIGLLGGIAGCLFGAGLTISLGPKIIGVPIKPDLLWCIGAAAIGVAFSVAFSWLPARKAASLDPAEILHEE